VPGSVHVGGRPIEANRVYSVTANYAVWLIAQVGMKLQLESSEFTGLPEYVALRDYVEHLKNVTAHPNGRIKDVAVADEP
jgi:hypothetical protein